MTNNSNNNFQLGYWNHGLYSQTTAVLAETLNSYIGDYLIRYTWPGFVPDNCLIESVKYKKGYTIVTCLVTHRLFSYADVLGRREKFSFAPGTMVSVRFKQEEKEKE